MNVTVRQFSSDSELALAHQIRREVFHDEQGVSLEEDFDGLDEEALQFLALDGEEPIGTARVLLIDGKAKIQRVAVLKAKRGHGVGSQIMLALLDVLRDQGVTLAYLDSQTHAIPFYVKLGFVPEGKEFDDAGIAHIRMSRPL